MNSQKNKNIQNRDSFRSDPQRSYCCGYFFSICRGAENESVDPKDKYQLASEDARILMSQHYSTNVKQSIGNTLHDKNSLQNPFENQFCLPLKFFFRLTHDLRIYHNMQVMLTFNTNLFLLRSRKRGIIAKISLKMLKLGRLADKSSYQETTRSVIQRLSNKTTIKNSFNEIDTSMSQTPSKLSQKILMEIIHAFAKKTVNQLPLVIDISGNEGISAVAWAREGAEVIAIEDDPKKLAALKANVILSGEKLKIDIIHGRLEDLPKIKGNLVFCQPNFQSEDLKNEEIAENVDGLRIQKTIEKKILSHCMGFADNFAILLPKYWDINELAEIFYDFFEENRMSPSDYNIHVEIIYVNNLLESYLVCFGPLFNIPNNDQINFLLSNLILETPGDCLSETRQLVRTILCKMGCFTSCQILAAAFEGLEEKPPEQRPTTDDLPFIYLKAAFELGFLKESQMNEYNERLANVKSTSNYSLYNTEQNTTVQMKDTFSFNPFRNIKNLPKGENEKSESDTPLLLMDNKSESESKKAKNDADDQGAAVYSPSSYSGILNSHESSSLKTKEIKENEFQSNKNENLIMIQKEIKENDDFT